MVGLDGVEEPDEVGDDESADLFTITAPLRRVSEKTSYTTGC
jgi:hypothetical protein